MQSIAFVLAHLQAAVRSNYQMFIAHLNIATTILFISKDGKRDQSSSPDI